MKQMKQAAQAHEIVENQQENWWGLGVNACWLSLLILLWGWWGPATNCSSQLWALLSHWPDGLICSPPFVNALIFFASLLLDTKGSIFQAFLIINYILFVYLWVLCPHVGGHERT